MPGLERLAARAVSPLWRVLERIIEPPAARAIRTHVNRVYATRPEAVARLRGEPQFLAPVGLPATPPPLTYHDLVQEALEKYMQFRGAEPPPSDPGQLGDWVNRLATSVGRHLNAVVEQEVSPLSLGPWLRRLIQIDRRLAAQSGGRYLPAEEVLHQLRQHPYRKISEVAARLTPGDLEVLRRRARSRLSLEELGRAELEAGEAPGIPAGREPEPVSETAEALSRLRDLLGARGGPALTNAFDRLSIRDRQILALAAQGATPREIAAQTGAAYHTVRQVLPKQLQRLRQAVTPEGPSPAPSSTLPQRGAPRPSRLAAWRSRPEPPPTYQIRLPLDVPVTAASRPWFDLAPPADLVRWIPARTVQLEFPFVSASASVEPAASALTIPSAGRAPVWFRVVRPRRGVPGWPERVEASMAQYLLARTPERRDALRRRLARFGVAVVRDWAE